MWLLECDGPLFNRKRLWLRPGSAHLFGRTKQASEKNTDLFVIEIEGKSVSKKHLKLSVAAVRAGTGSQLHARTEVILEDFSKLGTTLNGEKISQTTKVLKGDEHVLYVARYEYALRIRWHPVVLTVTGLSREEKKNPDQLAKVRERLESLDVKFTQKYVTGQTTHVVAEKRNLPPVLQALCFGKHAVTREYIDAIASAAREEQQNDGEPRAPLERDFDSAWPDPMKYVPPQSNEPNPVDASFLAPNPARADVFYGYTFVFIQQSQYDQLQPVVNAGSGKVLLFESFAKGQTDPRDFVAYVKNIAGEKGVGELEDSSTEKGVIVVRLLAKDDWEMRFMQDVDKQLNQRSMAQNEFLEPIIMNDAKDLRRRLVEEIDLTASVASSQRQDVVSPAAIKVSTSAPTSSQNVQTEQSPPATTAVSAKKRVKRPLTQSRFKSFDDIDDEPEPLSVLREEGEPMQDEPAEPYETPPATQTQQRKSRKRVSPEIDEAAHLDQLLPAQAAFKRRKLNEGTPAPAQTPATQEPAPKARKERDIDFLEEAKKIREEQEERAREEAEALKEAINDMDIVGPADLVTVEEMPVRSASASTSARASRSSSNQWRKEWNDRPNFKKFRRKGEERPARTQRVMVPLEEVKKKDFGIGEEYWLESSSKQKKNSQRETQQSQTLRADEDEGDESQFRRRQRQKKQPFQEDDDVQIVEPPSQRTRTHDTQAQAETQGSRKRPAAESAEQPPTRRAKTSWAREEESEEDDELAFPKGRGRRGRR